MKNSCKSWSEEELQILDEMLRAKHSMKVIGKALGRTENAVRNAFRNIVFHQLLTSDARKIAKQYHMDVRDLHETIVHPKYAIPVHKQFPWGALTTLVLIGGSYYAHLLCKNWMMLAN